MSTDQLETYDTHAGLRHVLAAIAAEKDEWAGIPMPLTDQPIVIEKTYPRAEELAQIGQKPPEADDWAGVEKRGAWWSTHKRGEIRIWRDQGKLQWGYRAGVNHFEHDLRTLGCSDAWGIAQEKNALQLLATLVPHRTFRQYLLCGMFLETSARSQITYVFRRSRPTVAVSSRTGSLRILCTLCLHPIAYYAGSWAGAMCPTDDLIAHLVLMRGDEHLYWRRSNQHPAYRPEAGL